MHAGTAAAPATAVSAARMKPRLGKRQVEGMTVTLRRIMTYVGRFAPSPTGPLHFGSLVAAVASWCDARAAGGRWLVRMEDVDKPREQPGAAAQILSGLAAFGLAWDGDVMVQSKRSAVYRSALERLAPYTFACACTRREIADSALVGADGAAVYPGTCRNGLPPGRVGRAVRMRVGDALIGFDDAVQGRVVQDLAREVGDFVLRRADGLFAYQLAVVVDDAEQGITDVVRGADLLDSTPRQILLQRALGMPQPRYLHVPVAVDAAGEKLSKQTLAAPLDPSAPEPALRAALAFLGQPPGPASRDALLRHAVAHWDRAAIPRVRAIAMSRPA
jgi:glutamyl-Q tRNA(Asp) synthetase